MKKAEQIDRDEKSVTARKFAKRLIHRAFRREVKADPENAPTRTRDATKGYTR